MARQKKEAQEESEDSTESGKLKVLDEILKENKDHHYAFDGKIDYTVSSGSLTLDIEMGGGIHPGIIRSSGVTEGGKALPIWTKVLLPDGSWKGIGSIAVGDRIMGKNGKPTTILGVFPQGKRKMNKLFFSDDTTAICCDEHLWSAKNFLLRNANRPNKTVDTREIKSSVIYGNGKQKRLNWSIDFCDPMEFVAQELLIHPYLMGALLGDGCFSDKTGQIAFSNTDKQILEKIKSLSLEIGDEMKSNSSCDYRFNNSNIKEEIKGLGLYGKLSNSKFIPKAYLQGSVEQRTELLRGLMDTDGNVDKRGKGSRAQFCTVSQALRDDLIYLVRSLGGAAWYREKETHFTYKGEKKQGQKAYILSLSFTNGVNPFFLNRKSDIFKDKACKSYRYIEKIEEHQDEECVCIKVDSEDSLYIIDDFIPTHNTSNALAFAKNFQLVNPEKGCVIYIKSEGRLSQTLIERAGVDTDPAKWRVVPTNDYEFVIDSMRRLIKDNDIGNIYFFIIDSLDALVPRNDLAKSATEANKTAGAALLTADLLRKMASGFSSKGHICFLISQVRSTIKINPYEKGDPKVTNASGGNAALHYSDWIMEFQQRWSKDYIYATTKQDGNPVGHWCKITFRKTPNEKSGREVRYPVKYGRNNGSSIWVEYEIVDQLLAWEFAHAKGAWITITDELIKELADNGLEFPKQHQGEANLKNFLEEHQDITKYLFNKFISALKK